MLRKLSLACLALLALAVPAHAGTRLIVGVDDDDLKWTPRPQATIAAIRDLGVKAIRITVAWHPGETRVAPADRKALDRAIAPAAGLRVVLSVYGRAVETPQSDAARAEYCSYAADLLRTYPSVTDLVVWNEPNSSRFWQPQFGPDGSEAAPAAYEALLARCWETLHAVRSSVNVIAASAPRGNDDPHAASHVSISPGNWYRGLGAAYKASARSRPIFDTVGHNAYPERTSERPWVLHSSSAISEGDYDKLMQALVDGFGGTGQPVPGQGRVTIWYMEQGFQSTIEFGKARLYTGRETDRYALPPWSSRGTAGVSGPAPDQATQLSDAVKLAYCQPNVGAFFNFELADEPSLGGWQSGVLWTDFTPKPSYFALKRAIAAAASGSVDCTFYQRAAAGPAAPALPTEVWFTAPPHKKKPKPKVIVVK